MKHALNALTGSPTVRFFGHVAFEPGQLQQAAVGTTLQRFLGDLFLWQVEMEVAGAHNARDGSTVDVR